MIDIQKRIEEADKNNKQKAEAILKSIEDSYKQRVMERIALEIRLEKEERLRGNLAAAERHKLMADIYASIRV